MLSLDAFLMRIWPSCGDLTVVQLIDDPSGRPDKAALINYPFSNISRAQIVAQIRTLEQQRANIYIALAGYKPGTLKRRSGRTAENAEWFRALWLDLDVGTQEHKYPTKRDAAVALQTFVNASGMPDPVLVSSGGGLHVYWPVDVDMDAGTWKPLAEGLKRLCKQHGLKTDKVTTDAARILRPIETTNWKGGNPRAVKLLNDAQPSSLQVLTALLTPPVITQQDVASYPINGNPYLLTTLDQVEPAQFDGAKILEKCAQMQWAKNHPDDVSYDMWRQVIGTLYKSNKPELIHEVSCNYTGYSYDETEAKARDWRGAGALCSTLEELHPGGCSGCAYRGTIKSPSAIGFITAPTPEIKIDPVTHMPEGWVQRDNALWLNTDEGPVKLYRGMIDIGMPYMERGSMGIARMIAPVTTIMNGAATQGHVDYATVNSPNELFKSLTTCGVVAESRHQKVFLSGMRSWLQEARAQAALAPSRAQLGWTSTSVYDHDASYILGNMIYNPDGSTTPARLVEQANMIGKAMHPHGSFDAWKNAFNLLALPGYEAHMVMSWIAFAAPLIRMDEIAPALVHAYSQSSSQGKTTVLNYINSVYGNPHNSSLFWTGNTTAITMQTGLTILNGVAMGVDEITLLGFDAARKTLYECTQQTSRKRSKQDGTMQESSMTKTMLYSTGNMSLQHIASTMQLDDTPLQMRLVEIAFKLPTMTHEEKMERRVLTDSVKHNFGHAAPVYIAHVVKNQAKVARRLVRIRKELETAIVFEDKERFQITSMAAMITGASIARHLGIIAHPVDRGVDWIIDWFRQQRHDRRKIAETPEAIFERMASDLQLHILVVSTDNPTNPAMGGFVDLVTKRPLKEVFGRHAQQEQRLYLDRAQVRNWLIRKGLDAKGMLDSWYRRGLLVAPEARQIRLAAHTGYDMPQRNYCYIFDLSILETKGAT